MHPILKSLAALAAVTLLAAGCGGGEGGGGELSGTVEIDGSSTVYPITEAMAEEFQRANPGVQVTVGVSGTGGGFKKFCAGETDVSDASRPIKDVEREACRENGISFRRFQVAFDGITVVVNPGNDWARCMTVDELKRLWQPGSTIQRWSQIRDGWPDEPIELYGPDTDSGTFDYFTEAVVGEEDASRSDYTASADDNVLVLGVEGERYALGYFGFAYYLENEGRLTEVGVDDGTGCTAPSMETIESGAYQPLSRPLFLYVKEASLQEPVVRRFVDFYLANGRELIPTVGYVPLSGARYDSLRAELGGASEAGSESAAGSGTGGGAGS